MTLRVSVIANVAVIPVVTPIVHAMHVALMSVHPVVMAPGQAVVFALLFALMFLGVVVIAMIVRVVIRVAVEVGVGSNCAGYV